MRTLDALVAEKVFGYTGIGYYSPPAEGAWTHNNSIRHDSKEEADAVTAARFPGRDDLESDLCHWKDGWGPLAVPNYTDDPRDDYEVLRHIRETWPEHELELDNFDRFQAELANILEQRILVGYGNIIVSYYEPGDYSRAALKVLEL